MPVDKYVTQDDAQKIAREAADRAVRNMVRELGIDADDYQTVEEWRDTLRWARQAKQGSEQVRRSVRKGFAYGAATTVGGGLAYGTWLVLQTISKAKGGG